MKVHSGEIEISTREKRELVNITSEVQKQISGSGVKEGICHVNSVHTTAGIYVNEDERGLRHDVLNFLEKSAPKKDDYRHNHTGDPNAEAHLRSILTGRGSSFAITGGRLELGTWENIMFVESDGPRRRRVRVKVLGE